MMTKIEFGIMFKAKLAQTCEITDLSRWAYQLYNDNSRGLEPSLKDILLDLARMADAPEFEYSHDELIALAKSLE